MRPNIRESSRERAAGEDRGGHAQLDRLAQARKAMVAPGTARGIPAYYRQVSELWSAEARVWANLTKASDFPLGTHHGALLALAAGYAAQHADARAMPWWKSSGRDEVPAEAT
jgi:hypothetical protein